MQSPFRSEDAAFSFLLRGVAVFLVVIVLIVAVRAIF